LPGQAYAHCPVFPTAGYQKPGPCLSSNVAVQSLNPAKDQRLG